MPVRRGSGARRAASRRSTPCRWPAPTRRRCGRGRRDPTASGARSSASVAACASGAGSISSPYAAKHSRPSQIDRRVRCSVPSSSASASTPADSARDHLLPEVVVRHARGRAVPRDRVQPPLERHPAGPVVAEPGLGAVDVAVDRGSEVRVEGDHERRLDTPHAGRGQAHRRQRTGRHLRYPPCAGRIVRENEDHRNRARRCAARVRSYWQGVAAAGTPASTRASTCTRRARCAPTPTARSRGSPSPDFDLAIHLSSTTARVVAIHRESLDALRDLRPPKDYEDTAEGVDRAGRPVGRRARRDAHRDARRATSTAALAYAQKASLLDARSRDDRTGAGHHAVQGPRAHGVAESSSNVACRLNWVS